jgi:hypothetical protein
MPFYVVRRGRNPGIYNTWLEEKFFLFNSSSFVFEGMNAINKFIDFPEVRIEYSEN